jgi:hypothetical protein
MSDEPKITEELKTNAEAAEPIIAEEGEAPAPAQKMVKYRIDPLISYFPTLKNVTKE